MSRLRPRLSQRIRLALLMAVAVAVLGGANRLYFETRFLDELETELEWRGLGLARYLAAESVDLVMLHDRIGLQRLLDNAEQTTPDFAYAFLLDPSNRVLAHTFDGGFPDEIADLNRFREPRGHSIERIEVFGETFRDFAVPLHSSALGVLRVGVRDRRILDRIAAVRRELLLLMFGAMLVAAGGAFLLTSIGLRPLDRIAAALERFEPGRHREAIELDRNDEIGDLARKINEVTARLHEAHRHLVRTERMASVGVMASGVAHEINNPITGIQNCVRRIRARPADAAQVEEYAEVMLAATEHIAGVVRGLLDFSRGGEPRRAEVDLRTVLDKALDLAGHRLEKRGVEIARTQPDRPVRTLGDDGRLTQVVVNLLLNAVDAMPEGGQVELRLSREGSDAVLRISDEGAGIPSEQLDRVFEPFFTTKQVGEGTGLGLAVSHGIVTDHGGSIGLQSVVGAGTVVTVRLPTAGGRDA